MLKIGLTGGIGSGKTIVSNYFKELGIGVVDSDHIARQLTEVDAPAYRAMVNKWGKKVITLEGGDLNRSKVREIIFASKVEKKWLEDLLHPLIKLKIKEAILHVNSAYCVIVIPLLVESQSYDLIDRILVVDTPVEKQIEHVLKRDRLTRNVAIKIINSQASREQRIAIADDILLNNTDLAEVKNKVAALHSFYLQLIQS